MKKGFEGTYVIGHPALEKQSQVDLCDIMASLVYRVNFQTSQSDLERPRLSKQTKRR